MRFCGGFIIIVRKGGLFVNDVVYGVVLLLNDGFVIVVVGDTG